MKENTINTSSIVEYLDIISDLANNEYVRQMEQYRQHYDTSCYDHCLEVSYISYKVCKKLKLDYISAARAGLLHDLFLYDWRNHHTGNEKLFEMHAFTHPQTALDNAKEICNLNKKEEDIILNHMWPVTFYRLPKSRESFIITLVDKYSALISFKEYLINKFKIFNKSEIKDAN